MLFTINLVIEICTKHCLRMRRKTTMTSGQATRRRLSSLWRFCRVSKATTHVSHRTCSVWRNKRSTSMVRRHLFVYVARQRRMSLSVDGAALSSYKNLIVSTDWQSSTDGAVQACANDRAVLYDLRGRTHFVNNELCSRACESQPSIVAPSMVAQTSSRLIAQRCRPMPPQTVDGAQHSHYTHHRLLILSSAHPDVCWLFRC